MVGAIRRLGTMLCAGTVAAAIWGHAASALSMKDMDAATTHDETSILIGEFAVFYHVVYENFPASRDVCNAIEYVCMGPSLGEQGLALLSAYDTPMALEGLASLYRYRKEAGLSDQLRCRVLAKGPSIRPFLENSNPDAMAQQCADDVRLNFARDRLFRQFKSDLICGSPIEIQARLSAVLEEIEAGVTCK